MEENNRSGFWKGFLIGALVFFVIGALAVAGLTTLLKNISDRRESGSTPSVTEAPSQISGSTEPASSVDDSTAVTPSTDQGQTQPTAKIVDRNSDVFLNRFADMEEIFDAVQVLNYDLAIMEEEALRTFAEAGGADYDDLIGRKPDYAAQNITVIERTDHPFLNRLGELRDLIGPDDATLAEMEDASYRAFVAASGDIYSAYLTEEEWDAMLESTSGTYYGIGVQISQDMETMASTVMTVFSNSPAKEAGMLAGDIFYAVDGVDVRQMSLDEIVTMVRGNAGTKVTITVYRPSTGETLDIVCERRQVSVDTVEYEMLTDSIGYIKLTEFDEISVTQVKSALESLMSQGMTQLVFDLRGNPGGLLDSVLSIADYFVKSGELLFKMEYKSGEVYTQKASRRPIFTGEMVVLVNGGSASASEVLTGILQDYGLATIMGTQTYGKGIVQSYYLLDEGGALKVTTAHYFSPLGRDFHGVGITPDVIGEDDPLTEDDELLDEAVRRLEGNMTR